MNKRKIFHAIGTFLLMAACAVAVKANYKKRMISSLYYTKGSGGGCYAIQSTGISSLLFTSVGWGVQATILTMNGIQSWHIYGTSACSTIHKIYFKG